ncbi:MAG: DUF4177 domain-containing protein [Clostridia bacterium]|nr:DUF4177 domain-containing protein [Clostridia bacterium]
MRYEYKVVPIKIGLFGLFDDSKKQIKQLNELGAQGWKLVVISKGRKYEKYVFIRELG